MSKIKILVIKRSKTITNAKGKKVKFDTYRTKMNIPEIEVGEDGKEYKSAPVDKWVDLKFGKEVSEDAKKNLVSRGYITIDANDVSAPFVYKIAEEENEDGETVKKYPAVWIHGAFDYTPAQKKPTQNAFVVENDDESVEIPSEDDEVADEPSSKVDDDLPF